MVGGLFHPAKTKASFAMNCNPEFIFYLLYVFRSTYHSLNFHLSLYLCDLSSYHLSLLSLERSV